MSFCTECPHRKERQIRSNIGPDGMIRPDVLVTNKGGFCGVGYTQNPRTKEAAENVLSNNGQLCPNNPFYHFA